VSSRSDSEINTRRNKSLPNLWSLLAAHNDQRRACALPSDARKNKFATNIKLVGRNQVEILWFPEPVRRPTLGKHISAAIGCRHM
jgi:hypothetical protein